MIIQAGLMADVTLKFGIRSRRCSPAARVSRHRMSSIASSMLESDLTVTLLMILSLAQFGSPSGSGFSAWESIAYIVPIWPSGVTMLIVLVSAGRAHAHGKGRVKCTPGKYRSGSPCNICMVPSAFSTVTVHDWGSPAVVVATRWRQPSSSDAVLIDAREIAACRSNVCFRFRSNLAPSATARPVCVIETPWFNFRSSADKRRCILYVGRRSLQFELSSYPGYRIGDLVPAFIVSLSRTDGFQTFFCPHCAAPILDPEVGGMADEFCTHVKVFVDWVCEPNIPDVNTGDLADKLDEIDPTDPAELSKLFEQDTVIFELVRPGGGGGDDGDTCLVAIGVDDSD